MAENVQPIKNLTKQISRCLNQLPTHAQKIITAGKSSSLVKLRQIHSFKNPETVGWGTSFMPLRGVMSFKYFSGDESAWCRFLKTLGAVCVIYVYFVFSI